RTAAPGSVKPSTASAIASETPQVIVTSVAGSTFIELKRAHFFATASRNSGDPHVKAYWWLEVSARIRGSASRSSGGGEKSGSPCARLTPPVSAPMRVISRMTDSCNGRVLFERTIGLPASGRLAGDRWFSAVLSIAPEFHEDRIGTPV